MDSVRAGRRYLWAALPLTVMVILFGMLLHEFVNKAAEQVAAQTATQTAVATIEQRVVPKPPAKAANVRVSWTPECLFRIEWDLTVMEAVPRSYRVTLRDEIGGREIETQAVRSSSSTGAATQGQGTREPGFYPGRFWEFRPVRGVKGTLIVFLSYATPNRDTAGEAVIFLWQPFDWRAIPCTPPKAAAEPWGGPQYAMQGPF